MGKGNKRKFCCRWSKWYRLKSVKLPTQFECPFCRMRLACEVTMDRVSEVGKIECKNCKECFQTQIHRLSEEIDVHCDWVDAIEEANKHLNLKDK